jgi:hypothetical protein
VLHPFPRVLGADSQEERAMHSGVTVCFQDVHVVATSDLAVCCRITGRNYWFKPARLLEGSTVARFGDRGVIVVARKLAEEQGLMANHRPRLAGSC